MDQDIYYEDREFDPSDLEEEVSKEHDPDVFDIEDHYENVESASTSEEKEKIKQQNNDPFAYGAELASNYQFEVQFVKIPEAEKKRMYASYGTVYVNDFDDGYHISDEEMQAKMRYWKEYREVMNIRKNIRDLSTYIRACRKVMKYIRKVAEDNIVYDPDEFVSMVIDGKITLDGAQFPKYKGRYKKRIDWDTVATYIMDETRNPELLDKEIRKSILVDTSLESPEDIKYVLSEEEKEIIRNSLDEDREAFYHISKDPLDTATSISNTKISGKKYQRLHPDSLYVVEEMAKADKLRKSINSYSSSYHSASSLNGVVENDLEWLSQETAKRYQLQLEAPVFEGDFFDDDAWAEYEKALSDWETEHNYISFHERRFTKGDAELYSTKEFYENLGYDVRNFYQMAAKEKRERALKQEEQQIRQTNLKIQMAKVELETILNMYGTEEAILLSGEKRYQDAYIKTKKQISKLEKHVEKLKERRDACANMNDQEYEKYIAKEQKHSRKKKKKKKNKDDTKDTPYSEKRNGREIQIW